MQNDLFNYNNSMLDICPADVEYSSQAIGVVHFLCLNL